MDALPFVFSTTCASSQRNRCSWKRISVGIACFCSRQLLLFLWSGSNRPLSAVILICFHRRLIGAKLILNRLLSHYFHPWGIKRSSLLEISVGQMGTWNQLRQAKGLLFLLFLLLFSFSLLHFVSFSSFFVFFVCFLLPPPSWSPPACSSSSSPSSSAYSSSSPPLLFLRLPPSSLPSLPLPLLLLNPLSSTPPPPPSHLPASLSDATSAWSSLTVCLGFLH